MFWRMNNEERLSADYSAIKEKYEKLKIFTSVSTLDLQRQISVLRLLNQGMEVKIANQKKIIHELQVKYNKLKSQK